MYSYQSALFSVSRVVVSTASYHWYNVLRVLFMLSESCLDCNGHMCKTLEGGTEYELTPYNAVGLSRKRLSDLW